MPMPTPVEMKAPTKEQLADNLKMIQSWVEAVKGGTYQGHRALPIVNLLGFLDFELKKTRELLDSLLEDAANKLPLPDWAQAQASQQAEAPRRPDVELKHLHPETNALVPGCDACAASKAPAEVLS